MKVGVNLINFGPSARPDTLAQRVRLVESLGYHLLMTSDHIAITSDVHGRYPAPFYEPFSTLGWLAGITQHMALGTTVIILPYRNILETARVMANIDQLSGGRLIFGVGVGWAQLIHGRPGPRGAAGRSGRFRSLPRSRRGRKRRDRR